MNGHPETGELDLTAVLLCGGKGERLRPLTETVPKPLVPLRGRPLLHHLMCYLRQSGTRLFVLCVGHRAELIERFLAENRAADWDVCCVNSGAATMTDRLRAAREHVRHRALICYGDTLANIDLRELLRRHLAWGGLATMTTYPLLSPFGIVHIEAEGRVLAFEEKPKLPYWINIGFILCELAAFDLIRPGTDMPEFLGALAARGELFAYKHDGKHLTVNTEKDHSEAERDIATFYTLPQGEQA
jgi:glucose-1-phosphate cytidylyltransferase